jgi:hypothetical protein
MSLDSAVIQRFGTCQGALSRAGVAVANDEIGQQDRMALLNASPHNRSASPQTASLGVLATVSVTGRADRS